MSSRNDAMGLPPDLARLQERFEGWRRTRERRRIPERLWLRAGRAAAVHGVSRTARALRLNVQALRARMPAAGLEKAPTVSTGGGFVEFTALPEASAGCRYVLELESVGGDRLRLEVRGTGDLDVAALTRSFIGAER